MAKAFYNALGKWSGKVGANVYSKLFGNQIIRERTKGSNPNTEEQKMVRAKLAFVSQLGGVMDPAVSLGMKKAAKRERMFPQNLFSKENYGNLQGTAPDNLSIDPSKIVLSKGNMTGVVFSSSIGTSTPGTLTVSVADINAGIGKASNEDSIYAVVYCPDAKAAVLSAAARRTDGATLSVRYPTSWSGLEVHVYGFVVGGSRKYKGVASTSEYVGHAELG